MPKADAAWGEHTTAAQKEVEKDGGITVKVLGWQCNYCNEKSWNKALDRLRRHLTGDEKLCRGCKIKPCTAAPEEVRKEMTATLADRQALADGVAKRKATSEEIADEFGQNRAKQIQQKMVAKRKSVSALEMDGALSRSAERRAAADDSYRRRGFGRHGRRVLTGRCPPLRCPPPSPLAGSRPGPRDASRASGLWPTPPYPSIRS